ncbi:MAG: Ig-like domain-containing protein [Candidatus Xenobia bacterium]
MRKLLAPLMLLPLALTGCGVGVGNTFGGSAGGGFVGGGLPVMSFSQNPADIGVSQVESVQVAAVDGGGNPLSGIQVTLGMQGQGALTGNTTALTDFNGVASFQVGVTSPGVNDVLTAFSPNIGSATSLAFTVSPTLPTGTLAYVVAPPTGTAGTPFDVQVEALVNGQPVAGVAVQLFLDDELGSVGTLTGTSLTATTNGQGIADFPGLVVTAPGTYQLSAGSLNFFTATSTPFNE